MRSRLPAPLLLLAVAMAAAGCVSPRYVPAMRHTPLMRRAGEVQGRIESGHGFGAAVFGSPLPHLTVFGEVEGETGVLPPTVRGRASAGAGIGTYVTGGPFAAEGLGGFSVGQVGVANTFYNPDGPDEFDAEVTNAVETRAFVQANMGLTPTGTGITFGATARLTRARQRETEREVDGASAPLRSYAATFAEPGVFMRATAGTVTVEVNYVRVLPVSGGVPAGEPEPAGGGLTYEPDRFGIGLALALDRIFAPRRR